MPIRTVLLLLTSGLAVACGAPARGPHEREFLARRYVFGAFGGTDVDVRDACPAGPPRRIRLDRTALDYVVSFATLGMYLPHRVRVDCARPER